MAATVMAPAPGVESLAALAVESAFAELNRQILTDHLRRLDEMQARIDQIKAAIPAE